MFFESNIITSFDIWFDYFHRESIVKNKLYCSFLNEKNPELGENILKSLGKFFPDCKVIEFGKMTMYLEREFTVIFTIFNTKEILFDTINGKSYPRGNFEVLKERALHIRNSLSQTVDIMVVKRFIANIFLTDKLKDTFRRTMEKIAGREKGEKKHSPKIYYQNYERFPFLIEFQTNFFINFKNKLDNSIQEFYTILSPFINETGSLFTSEFSFCELKLYMSNKFDKNEVANNISISFLNYIFSLYTRIFDNITIYRKRVEHLSRKLKFLSGKVLTELNEQLIGLQRIIFEENPLIYIGVLDRYILYEDDEENPDITDQIFGSRSSHVSIFRRSIDLLNEKIKNFQSEIKTLLLYKRDRIMSFSKEELVNKLNSIKYEQDFRKKVLLPILKDLGYENIQEIHGQHEYGVDILFSNQNRFNLMEWNAIIAKIGDINLEVGTELSQNLKKIFTQIYQAKSMNHLEKNYGNVKINRVFIATNGKINYYAKNVLSQKDPVIEGNIFFIDYDVLLNLF
ncbi:MAG: hypothetical protein ACFFDF_19735 [Candidatus Odinarchaeota archaeon]